MKKRIKLIDTDVVIMFNSRYQCEECKRKKAVFHVLSIDRMLCLDCFMQTLKEEIVLQINRLKSER